MNLENKKEVLPELKIIPLGGAGTVTKNMWVYEYEDDIVIIDCGMGFPDEDMLGVDLVIPDITYLRENAQKIRGMFLTHGHEDHIGAIPYVLRELGIPVYGAELTIGLVKARLAEHKMEAGKNLNVVKADDSLNLGAFHLEFFRLSHSIPDNLGVILTTPVGNIMHAADYKFDWTPVDNKPTEVHKIARMRNKINVLLSDCVRIEKEGYTLTEQAIQDTFEEEIRKAKGRVLITTFSSNISRLQQAINAAHKYHRKISFIGRSIYRNMEVAQKLGYLNIPDGAVIDPKKINKFTSNELVVLVSGSQGQSNSALARVANGDHPMLQIEEGDIVIFASDPIPGNVDAVYRVIDQLSGLGAEVRYSEITDEVHVSGHAAKEELKFMLGLVNPRFAVPIGGELRHNKMFAQIAKKMGVEKTFVLKEGQTLKIYPDTCKYGEMIKVSEVMIDGTGLEDVQDIVVRDRQVLAKDGIFVVIITIDKNSQKIIGEPEIVSRGFVYMKEADKIVSDTKSIVAQAVKNAFKDNQELNVSFLRRQLIDNLEKYIYRQTEMRPMVMPVIVKV